ncbi:MAG: GNAT family N-acetyltransferase [Gemmatimonadales bacterium]
MTIPVIETERMILREFREEDFPAYEKLAADIAVMRYLGGKTQNTVEAWRHMAFLVGHWTLKGYGYWAAEEKGTGQFIGRIGFSNPAGWPGFELGWTIAPSHQGKGLASEGARRLLQYAFTELDRSHVISLIHPDNTPSRRVAEKLGETIEGETEVLGMPVLVYGVDRP